MKRLVFNKLAKLFNMKPYFFKKTIINFTNDFKNEKRTTFKEKIWAYRRGFTSSKIIEYGINETNYRDYLSEVTYYRLFPLNENYSFWIDDKVTVKYVLSKFSEHLPEYYFHLRKGNVFPAMDWNSGNNLSISSVIDLLTEKNSLAVKQESGSLGEGFYKLEYKNNEFYINNEKSNERELINLINGLDDYLVTEFIMTHKEINKVFPNVANTLRIMVIKDGANPSQLGEGYIRFGTKGTKVVDNASAGGIFSMIDVADGSFEEGYRKLNGVLESHDVHPDTKVPIKGVLPNWEFISTKLLEISDYLSELSWMGFDVAITDDGFKILEINSHPNITRYQYFEPLLAGDDPLGSFLNKKLKEKSIK